MDLCDKDNLSDCHEDNKGEICEQQTVQYCSAGESSSSAEVVPNIVFLEIKCFNIFHL